MTDDLYCGCEPEFEMRLETFGVSGGTLNARSSGGTPAVRFDHDLARRVAIERDAAQPQTFELSRLWHELCSGTWRFKDTFSTDDRYFAVLERVAGARPFRPRYLNILERVLLGQSPKAVAIDLRVAVSTVAGALQACLRRLGLPCRLANASLVLTMAACAAHRPPGAPVLGRSTRLDPDEDSHWVVSVPRPDLDFPVRLSTAEVAVVRQLVAGRTHAQISGARATSRRTVANQLATAFRKFGVSGRGAVVQQLIAHSLESTKAAGAARAEAALGA